MSSALRRCSSARRHPALLLALALGGLGACDSSDNVHEILGVVQTWPGEVPPTDPARPAPPAIRFQAFDDEVGRRAATETRALITSAAGYADYFGHAAPAEVDFRTEWVIFYAAGTQRSGGYRADLRAVAANADTLTAVTVLFVPGAGCAVTDALTTPYVLVKFPAQATRSVIFQHSDQPTRCGDPAPVPPGCAAILCPVGSRCVEDKSNPPQARCQPIETPPGCASSAQCPAGLLCSTELGVCGSNPACRDGRVCDTACWGTCVKTPDPGPARCTSSEQCGSGQRCSTQRGDCLGCGAMSALVACPAVCFGVCEPIPTPPVCVTGVLMGGCRSADAIKAEAADVCQRRNLALTDFAVGGACFAGGFVEAKYTCCNATMPPPPPPPSCRVDSDCTLTSNYCGEAPCTCQAGPAGGVADLRAPLPCVKPPVACLVDPCAGKVAACVAGQCTTASTNPPPPTCTWEYQGGATSCKSYDVWKSYAADACGQKGQILTSLATGASCEGGNFTEIKYECCPTR